MRGHHWIGRILSNVVLFVLVAFMAAVVYVVTLILGLAA